MRDLLITLPEGERPGMALERQLRDAIRGGRLIAGTNMPSTRALASDLGIARSTVVTAYEQLAMEGYLQVSQGKSTVVADLRRPSADVVDDNPMAVSYRHDLRPGEPSVGSFPRKEWLAATKRVMAGAADDVFGYSDPRGRIELRSELADYLSRVRGVHSNPQQIWIYTGYASALGFLGEMLRRRRVERVAVEHGILPFHRRILELQGLTTVAVAVDDDGLCVDKLAGVDVGAVLVTPANNFPFGATLSPDRRTDLVEWARVNDAWIVEDDYDGEFRFDRRPIGALQGLDPERVVYAGTASKSLAPGVRVSWLVVPPDLRRDLSIVTHIRGGGSVIGQLVIAELLASGVYDRHVRRRRGVYRHRRDQLVSGLEPFDWLEPVPVHSGLHLLARLSGSVGEGDVLAAAEAASVGVAGMRTHLGTTDEGVVIGFGRPADHEIDAALDALFELCAQIEVER